MPGLIRGVARTAVVAGTATAVSNNVSRRQAARWQQQGAGYAQQQPMAQQPVAVAEPAQGADPMFMLRQLYAQGILTDEEFQAIKARV